MAECAEALGERAGDMLDDILERADASLDRARALLKAARDLGFGSGQPEAAPALAAAPVAGGSLAQGDGGLQLCLKAFGVDLNTFRACICQCVLEIENSTSLQHRWHR